MSTLQPIAHQFIDLVSHPERRACGACDDQPEPCPEFGPNDPIHLQLYNAPVPVTTCLSPCQGGGDGDPCGTFQVNADMCKDSNLWTFTGNFTWLGSGFFPDCGIVVPDAGLASSATLDVSQWQALAPGVYRISFNLHVVYDGDVWLEINGLTSPHYSAPGTYDWIVYLDGPYLYNPLTIRTSDDFYGDIISVRAGLAAKFWTGFEFGGWTVDADACGWQHQTGNNTPLTFNYPLANGTYKITFRVADVSDVQAYVDLSVGSYFFGRYYGNGPHVVYVWIGAAAATPTWTPSSSWDGLLTLEGLDRSYRGHQFALVTGTQVAAPFAPAYYEGDYVTIQPVTLNSMLDPFGDPVPDGCYDVAVWDETEATANPFWEVIRDPELQNLGQWVVLDVGSVGSYDWATNPDIPIPYFQHQFQAELARVILVQNVDPYVDRTRCYRLEVEIQPTFGPSGSALPFAGSLQVTAGTFDSGVIPIGGPVTFTWELSPIGDTTVQNLGLFMIDATFAIARVSLRPCAASLPVDFATFRSSCIKLTRAMACESNYVEGNVPGTFRPDPLGQPNEWRSPIAYGFQWNRFFRLAQRVNTYFLNPTSDGDQDRYVYRNGRNQRTAGSTERRWELVLGGLGYVSHDAMATLVKCQEVRLAPFNPTVDAGTYYLITDDEYNPQWAKGAHAHRADVQLEVVRLEKSRRYLRAIF